MQDFNRTGMRPPQAILDLVNQVFEIEKKLTAIKENNSIMRNIRRLKEIIEKDLVQSKGNVTSIGFSYHNPLGEDYVETRTDCEATIAGSTTNTLKIVEVIRPIIFCSFIDGGTPVKIIAQKAVVVVKSVEHS